MKGSGASGNICRAAARSPPCESGSSGGGAALVGDRMSLAIPLLALLVEATFGYPDRVLRAIGHPVMWLGRMIDWVGVTLNRDTSGGCRRNGAAFVAASLTLFIPAVLACVVEHSLLFLPRGFVSSALFASTLSSQ